MSDFFELVDKYDKIIIYGAGTYAYYVSLCIDKDKIVSYAVTHKPDTEDSVFGKPLINASEISADDDTLIVIAVAEPLHTAISETLKLLRLPEYIYVYITYEVFDEIAAHVLSNHYAYKALDVSADEQCVSINGVRFRNPKNCEITPSTLLTSIDDLFMCDFFTDEGFHKVTEGSYEIENVKLEKDNIVFDAGAHIGLFSCIAANKGCTVYAFEPTASLIDEINFHSSLYENRIIPVETALADYTGTTRFNAPSVERNSTGAIVDGDSAEDSIEVNVTTIDEFVEKNHIERVDFIKADIEGAERHMLKGAVNTLKKFAPKLAICTYHLRDDKEVLERIVKEANPDYKIVHKWKKMYCWVDKDNK